MEIKNIKQSQSKSRVCYFDLELEENSILLENIRLIKLENNEFYLGMITSIKSSYFNCKFINSKLEQEIISALLKTIPSKWIELAATSKFKVVPSTIEINSLVINLRKNNENTKL